MFRIRRVHDDSLPRDREAISQAQMILKSQFGALSAGEIKKLPQRLKNPLKYRFRSILHVADDSRGRIRGFALLLHASDLGFCYLDFMSVDPGLHGGGIGGALYERVRDEARNLSPLGLFFECLPDDTRLCREKALLKQNRARLRFYERFGARPVINTAYETPLKPGGDCPPYLVFDPLNREIVLKAEKLKQIVHAILDRKYGKHCPPGYIEMVIESIKDDPVQLRKLRYHIPAAETPKVFKRSIDRVIGLVINDKHEIHHVHERGYVEAPVRVRSILQGIEGLDIFVRKKPRHFPEGHIKKVHDTKFVEYLKRVCNKIEKGRSVYPYVFPIRNATRPPRDLPMRAGYYCMDTFTPLNRNAYVAAKRSVDCALTAAEMLLTGYRITYCLVRPPGHHAEKRAFGGFCYFNSAAIAADFLSSHGKVAVLDVDYHHGNGTQEIFYERSDVLTLSIHGNPDVTYPYFSGFHDEHGRLGGLGYNVNYPLPEHITPEVYRNTLRRALRRVERFHPRFLVISLGFDPAKDDPTGTWGLKEKDFEANGRMIGSLKLPTLVVQEGGYRVRSLGVNARHFFLGLWESAIFL
ncbi:MAG TPA: histone deacetylase family protein [Deltaproteobacteria bacterium]|nr:histone deacetylase family protein [Deltaproteobacteria bacterium]